MKLACAVIVLLVMLPLRALDVGDSSPSLVGVNWLGAPPGHASQRLTLLTLWTPDDPVYRRIMPRLTDLQRRHPEVAIIGLSAADQSRVEPVLQDMSGRIGYANGLVSRLDPFMPPAGLPCSVLLDAHGTVLWWGHPLDAAEPLAAALQGTLHVETPTIVANAAADVPVAANVIPVQQPPLEAVRCADRREVVEEPARHVVVIEPEHCWWAWRCWPVPPAPIFIPCRPFLVAPPLPPPLWHLRPFRR